MIYKLNNRTNFKGLRNGDIIQAVDNDGTILIMGKYSTSSGLILETSCFIGTLTNVILDRTILESSIVLNGVKYTKKEENWTFEVN